MKEIQKKVDEWVSQYAEGYWQPLEIMARLTEEVGELAREVNHRFGPKKKKTTEAENEIGAEMADIVYTLACMANSLDIDLDAEFAKVMEKLSARDKDRFEKK